MGHDRRVMRGVAATLAAVIAAAPACGPRASGGAEEPRSAGNGLVTPAGRRCAVTVDGGPNGTRYTIDCQPRVAWTLVDHRVDGTRLRDVVVAAGGVSAAVTEEAIRDTAEYRSYMEAALVWQWGRQVTAAEALAACRAMVADMADGKRVDWASEAGSYLAGVRQTYIGQTGRARRLPSVAGSGSDGGGVRTADTPGGASATPSGPPDVGPQLGPRGLPDSDIPLDWWTWSERLRRYGSIKTQHDTQRLTEDGDRLAGALTVLMAGVTIVVAGVIIAGAGAGAGAAAVEGATAAELTAIAQPIMGELADVVFELKDIAAQGGAPRPPWALDLLSLDEMSEFRHLVHYRPVGELGQIDIERLETLRIKTGLPELPGPSEPGLALHKSERWADYVRRGKTHTFKAWSNKYHANMTRASNAHRVADEVHRQLGWGKREVRVRVPGEGWRVMDIADKPQGRGVEVKSGYVSASADVMEQLRKDTILVQKHHWTITWHVEGRISEPLRQSLRKAGIRFVETQPDMPIRDVRRSRI